MSGRILTGALIFFAACAVTACNCTSDGLELRQQNKEGTPLVNFSWLSTGDVSGTMTGSLGDGRTFSGPYFKIAADTRADQLASLWDGWTSTGSWKHWRPGPDFTRHYSGMILASLETAGGERMRCQFDLAHASFGMNGGGEGICQLTDGLTIQAALAPARPIKRQRSAAADSRLLVQFAGRVIEVD